MMRFSPLLKKLIFSVFLICPVVISTPSLANDSYLNEDDEKTPEWKTPSFISSFIGVITSGKLQDTTGDILTEPEHPTITKSPTSPNVQIKQKAPESLTPNKTPASNLPVDNKVASTEKPKVLPKESAKETSIKTEAPRVESLPKLAQNALKEEKIEGGECDYIKHVLQNTPITAQDHFELAQYYFYGHCTAKDNTLALRHFKTAANLGDVNAMHQLGLMYYFGTGVNANQQKAETYLKKAVAKKHKPSQKALTYLHKNRLPLTKKTKPLTRPQYAQTLPGFEQFNNAYQQALNLYNDSSNPENPKKAVSEFERLAREGYAPAQYTLGYLLLKGENINQNPTLAKEWFIKAANQGEVRSTASLGYLYLTGIGTQQDFKEAHRWFLKAANMNDPYAQDQLGLMYCKGQGTPVNFTHALAWYRCAARQDYVQAQFHLALLMFSANSPIDDPKEAQSWLKKAADNGHVESQSIYAGLLYTGSHNVFRDVEKSIYYFKKAATAGHAESHYLLGTIYVAGNGVLKDYAQARKWFLSAEKLNHPDAKKALAALDKLEKEEAQKTQKVVQPNPPQQQTNAKEVVQSQVQNTNYEDELAQ